MISSRSNKTQQMERELKMWWSQVSEARTVYRLNPADPILVDYLDELDVLHDMTDWPALKTIAAKTLVVGAEKIANAAAQHAADIARQCQTTTVEVAVIATVTMTG